MNPKNKDVPIQSVGDRIETGTVYNVNAYANVRSGPGTSYPIIGTIIKYGNFELTGETNLYYQIKFEDGIGYVAKSLSQIDHIPYEGVIVNVNSAAIVRSGPGIEYNDIGRALLGESIMVLNEFEEGSRYKKVQLEDGLYGYIYREYVDSMTKEKSHIVSNIKSDTAVNVRECIGTAYAVQSTIPKGELVDIATKIQDYYKIRLENEEIGYVGKEFIVTELVAIKDMNILDSPSLTAKKIDTVNKGDSIEIVRQVIDYYEINMVESTGFILKTDIEFEVDLIPQNDREAVVYEARKYIGFNYSTIGDGQGDTPDNGELDCSGLIKYAHEQVGYKDFPRTAREQWEECKVIIPKGEELDMEKLKVGDLIFYNTDPDRAIPGHVALYVGEGIILHARGSKGVIEEIMREDTWPTKYFYSAGTYLD